MRRRSARVGFGCVVAAERSCEARESEPGGEGWSLHRGEPEKPPPLPTPPPQPPPPRRPPPCADGRVRSRRGGASHGGRQHTAQHGPGNQAPLGGKLTGERARREDHRAFQTVSDTRPAAALAPRPPLWPVVAHRRSGDARLLCGHRGNRSGECRRASSLRAASQPSTAGQSPERPQSRGCTDAAAAPGNVRHREVAGARNRDCSPKIRAAADAPAVCAAGWSGLPGARRRLHGLSVSRGSRGKQRVLQGAADAFPPPRR